MPKITAVRPIRTRANGTWVIVKVETDQPGLYGIGSASDHYRAGTVVAAIEQSLAPKIVGREAGDIEDIWQSSLTSGYWRHDSIWNTAMAGVDMALWDILGKEASLPVYRLLGGPCRAAVPVYAHAAGNTLQELEDDIRRYWEDGWVYIRCQLGAYGGGGFVTPDQVRRPDNARPPFDTPRRAFDDEAYLDAIPQMFAYLRDKLGFGPKFTHDVHEHLRPHIAVELAKLVEPYRLFFLEDLLPPEHVSYYRQVKQQCTTPQAMGELFINPHEYLPLIQEKLIDYMRIRVSKAGGITPARKIANLCEWYGVYTAWQEGGDNDPVNQAAAMHLDMTCWNFGIQEENHFRPEELDIFPGHAVTQHGYMYPNATPGLGLDIDEAKADALLDPQRAARAFFMAEDRRPYGTVVRP
jgi:mannonate dehydratase